MRARVQPVPKSLVRFLGQYSEGFRLTAEYGTKSGRVFEYVYRNQAHGAGVVGRWLDRSFLQCPVWDAARQRVETTYAIVREILGRRRAAGETTLILDVASGTAPYLRRVARCDGGADLTIVCHDRDPRDVMLGRELAAAEGLEDITYAVGDATDEASYLTPRDPDIVLAVGLFATMPDDGAVRTVMRLAFARLAAGGWFVCTTLTRARDGGRLSNRATARSPELIARWLRDTGFVQIDQRFSQPHGFALLGRKPEGDT